MKKTIFLMICICVLCFSGCGDVNVSNESASYLDSLQEIYDSTENCNTEKEEVKELFPVPSSSSASISVTDENYNVISTPIINYSGGKMTYKIVTNIHQDKEKGPQDFKRVLYILIDGYLQPFYFENSDEEVLFASINMSSSYDLSEYTVSFDPIYVPYGENSVLSFVISSSPDYLQETGTEQVFCSSMEQNYCLTASEEAYAVEYGKEKCETDVVDEFLAEGNQTAGFILAEKIENTEQFKINTLLTSKEQLYATTVCIEDKNVRLFAIIDGQPAEIFGENYYIDLNMKVGTTYEIPLDMEEISKNEKHQIYFVEINMDEIEAISLCETGNEIMSHNLTSLTYAYACVCE